ncbi:MAG: META domain-containing protein [Chitinophagales bacterium]|nr:META domain-containing protein [Chitinophagales bacterium]
MRHVLILACTLIIVSCGTTVKNKESKKSNLYKKWELSSLGEIRPPDNIPPVYIELFADGKIAGFAGCNRLMGSYSTKNDNQITFSEMGATKMACSKEQMSLEDEVLKMFNTANSFTIDSANLHLMVGNNTPLATFCEMSNKAIVNKYWRLKTLDGKPVEAAKDNTREPYFMLRSDGTISGFAGCNHFNGQYKLTEGDRIRIGENLAVTLKLCPDSKFDENQFLEVFTLTDNYTINGDILNLNVGRRAPLAVFEAVQL